MEKESAVEYEKIANECGFSHIGFNKIAKVDEAFREYYLQWLTEDTQTQMPYLRKNLDLKFDPTLLHPGTNTIITMLFPYYKAEQNEKYKIASYVHNIDYHKYLRIKAKPLLDKIATANSSHKARFFTDSAPIADRFWAWKAGLGFIGKNGFLINKTDGSRFFIAHIFTSLIFDNNPTKTIDRLCGSCNKCIEACPTKAIYSNGKIMSNNCISYHTIESKNTIPEKIKKLNPAWIYGCDECLNACPYNIKNEYKKDFFSNDYYHISIKKISDWTNMEKDFFNKNYKHSPLYRTGLEKIKENIKAIDDKKL